MPKIIVDPQSRSLEVRYAVIHAPRRKRARFPAGVVEVCATEAEARAGADPEHNRHAAEVYSPSVSSEGLRLYYLTRWLDP